MKFVYLVILFFATPLYAALNVDVDCTSACLINSKTGKVLFAKEATRPMYPASCTKIAFALYAIKFYQPLFQKRIVASNNSLKSLSEEQKGKNNYSIHPSYILVKDASHMGLKVGEEMSFYELLEATMVVSADDGSNVIAEVMGNGSIDKCVSDVNRYMQSLGLTSTHFTNPHGLHHPNHLSTALDLAKLSKEAMKDPLFQTMAKKPRFVRPKTNKQASVPLQSTNRLLVKGTSVYYEPTIGIKTGYHSRAGHCVVAAAEKDDRSLIAVVLQAKNRDGRFIDAKKLFQAAFNEKKVTKTLLTAGSQPLSREVDGAILPLSSYTKEPVTHAFYPSEEPKIRCELVWSTISLPIQKDTAVGELLFYADDQLMQKRTLFAASDVEETFTHALKRHVKPWTWTIIIAFIGIVVAMLLFLKRK